MAVRVIAMTTIAGIAITAAMPASGRGTAMVMAEAVAMRLARHVGKQEAHALVQSAARDAAAGEKPFADVLAGNPAIARWLDRDALAEVLTPANYLGAAPQFIADVLAGADSKGNDD